MEAQENQNRRPVPPRCAFVRFGVFCPLCWHQALSPFSTALCPQTTGLGHLGCLRCVGVLGAVPGGKVDGDRGCVLRNSQPYNGEIVPPPHPLPKTTQHRLHQLLLSRTKAERTPFRGGAAATQATAYDCLRIRERALQSSDKRKRPNAFARRM